MKQHHCSTVVMTFLGCTVLMQHLGRVCELHKQSQQKKTLQERCNILCCEGVSEAAFQIKYPVLQSYIFENMDNIRCVTVIKKCQCYGINLFSCYNIFLFPVL